MNLSWLALGLLAGASSIAEQTGWSGSEIINVECPEGPNKSYCLDFCKQTGRNQTVAYMDSQCYSKLPPGSAILVTRDRRYGTGSGKVLYHGNSPDDVYHDRHGFMWGIDFTGDEVDVSHPERIKKAMIYMDLSLYWDTIDNVGEKMTTANHPVYLYRALLSTDHLKYNQGANQYLEGFHNDNAVVHAINLEHPDYKFLSWDSVEIRRHALNVTDFVAHTPNFPRGIVLRQPLLEKPIARRSENYTNRGRDAGLYMDVHEEVWVVADLNCGSFHGCEDCLAIEGCHWCYNSNGKHVCTDQCHKLWTDNQC